ncbi:hypothetical protein [Nocardia sp. CA-120079]|uniref:hypothetical protein n=1 Tax=Nocardia sp. CA-120079 TaxID=3239974 RepID=UPI003D95BB92
MRDKQSTGRSEIAALAERVANARGRLPLQDDAALVQALSDDEIDAERELAQWVRAQRRGQRKRAVQDELTAEKRNRRTMSAIQRADDADARWHRRALAARRRVSNQDARLAQLYRRAEWSSRALIAVVVLGMVWAGVNVQHNLVPSGNMADPLYWLSYGIEAMISIPIITIMVAATTAARWGRELDRGKVVFFETALLGTTIALNAGPHLAAGSFGQAAEYAIAPVMVGVVIWLHAWVSARYALLIDGVPMVEDEPDLPPRHRVTTERGAPIDTFRADEPTDRRELLAARGFDPLLDQAGVRFPVDMDPHVADAARRAAQPDAVPVSRLDCTETLVYHAQSTRSTNGRLTQQLPSDDRAGHAVRATDPIHDTARPYTHANETLPAHTSASAANSFGENTFHASDLDQRITPDTAASAERAAHATALGKSATAPMNARDTTFAGFEPRDAPRPGADERAPFADPDFAPQTAAPSATSTRDKHTAVAANGFLPNTGAAQRATLADTNFAPQTAAPSATGTRDEHTAVAANGFAQTGADERATFADAGSEPWTVVSNAAGPHDEHTTPAAIGLDPQTAATAVDERMSLTATTGFDPRTALAPAADERTTSASTGSAPRTATPSASGRDQHTSVAAAGLEPRTAATASDEHTTVAANVRTASATTASTRYEHTASNTSGFEARTAPAAADRGALPATADAAPATDIDLRTAMAADASTPDERTASAAAGLEPDATTRASGRDERSNRSASATSVVGEAEPQRVAAHPAAQSQLSIFDTATVESVAQTSADTGDRAQADTDRATVSRTATAGGTGTPADAPRPAKSSTRTETLTRTSTPTEPQRATRGSATPAPDERITRAVEGHRSSSADNSAADHEDQAAASEAEVGQLVPEDAPRRTTSEVISEVVQSLSAENLLTESLGSESDDIEVWSVARAIAGRGLSVIPVEQLAEILMLADQSWTPTSIGAEVGLSRTAIAQVLEFARRVRRPYAISS